MTRFTGTFVITTEAKYKFEIETETQESALCQLEDEPFSYISSQRAISETTFEVSEVNFEKQDKITFVIYARIGSLKNEERIEIDKAEYEAAEDKEAYQQELVEVCLSNLVDSGIYIEE